jgi:hypothetical protein
MIIGRLEGGLGNQLFQYATVRAIADNLGTNWAVDTGWYAAQTMRRFTLDRLVSHLPIVPPSQVAWLTGRTQFGHRALLWSVVRRWGRHGSHAVMEEMDCHYDPTVTCRRNAYLVGYWQCEQYFLSIRDSLLREINSGFECLGNQVALLADIDRSTSVSVHVRRGDYAHSPVTNAYHGTCSPEYYNHAVRALVGAGMEPQLFVFSDDLDWVRGNLRFSVPVTYVEGSGLGEEHIDLMLMSRCKHHVIANSSFSWWGAWLSCQEGMVIAPRAWFRTQERDTRDLLPARWLQF